MALTFLFRLAGWVLRFVAVRKMDVVAKDIEILVLRHELEVLRRKVPRTDRSWSDRALAVLGSQLLPRGRWSVFGVTPRTVLAWQRKLVRRRWCCGGGRRGRPGLDAETVDLVCRLARENPRWGYMRIAGELRKLGVVVSASSVRKVLLSHGLGPAPRREGPTWTAFVRAQASSMLATDFFHVDTMFGERFYGLFVIEMQTRVVRLLGVTKHPDSRWMAQIARNLVGDLAETGTKVGFLVRDRDQKFCAAFNRVIRSEGIRTIRTPVRAPKANAYAERWIRSVCQECLDHLLIFSQRQIERTLRRYVRHYNTARPHRGLQLDTPQPTTPTPTGTIRRTDILGGLIHEYHRQAA